MNECYGKLSPWFSNSIYSVTVTAYNYRLFIWTACLTVEPPNVPC